MMMRHITCIIVAALMGIASSTPVFAISPEEVMADPKLEERARDISKQLRCLVCQNQSIDDSDAELARDLRREVRLQLHKGMSDDQIFDYLQDRYGDYVLLNPPVNKATYALWAAPIVLLILGVIVFVVARRKPKTSAAEPAAIAPKPQDEGYGKTLAPKFIWGGFGALIALGIGLYLGLGRPDLTAQPISERQEQIATAQEENAQQSAQDQQLLAEASAAADAAPNSLEAQLTYAMTAARIGDYDAEVKALERALILSDRDPNILGLMAEAISRKANGLVTLPARQLIEEALKINPNEIRVIYLKGLAAYQDEDFGAALELWGSLASDTPITDPLAQVLARNLRSAATEGGIRLPTQLEDFINEAEAAPETQQAMIEGMVTGLEDRLAENPDDPEGWARLIQSRRVLNDEEGLMRALFGAAKAQADDEIAQIMALEELLERGIGDKYLEQALAVMDRLKTINPSSMEFLFFAGHFAALAGDNILAASLWQKLFDQLPEDAPIRDHLEREITKLKNASE